MKRRAVPAAEGVITAYEKSFKALLDFFGCPHPYGVRLMTDCAWGVTGDGDMDFLTYSPPGTPPQNAVIVRHDGKAQVYRKGGFAMVVAIDCVKTAFVLNEGRELKS